MEQLKIFDYIPAFTHHFTRLNTAWLQKYFYVEPYDEEILGNPKQSIIDKGGHIFFATYNGTVAGTFAFMKVDDYTYELSKMAVDESFQGKKVGNALMQFAIEKGKALGAQKLVLYSNTILNPAIHLYKKYGFEEVVLEHSEYKRSNIKMEKTVA